MSKPYDDDRPLVGILLQYDAMIEENWRLRKKVAKYIRLARKNLALANGWDRIINEVMDSMGAPGGKEERS